MRKSNDLHASNSTRIKKTNKNTKLHRLRAVTMIPTCGMLKGFENFKPIQINRLNRELLKKIFVYWIRSVAKSKYLHRHSLCLLSFK